MLHCQSLSALLSSALSFSLLLPSAAAQDAPARVQTPTFQNPTCPIMGKKVSMPLFIDTELGRFYVCCKPCYKKILANVPAAHKTGYPVVEQIDNVVCPVSGEAIGELAVPVTLQGYRFKVCCSGCVEAARQQHQVTLTKVTMPKVVDVGNRTSPVSGQPVQANVFALVDGAIVHFATAKEIELASKTPAEVLAKARTIAAEQPQQPKHEHVPAPKSDGKDEPSADQKGDGKEAR